MKTTRFGRTEVVLPGHDNDLRAVPDLGRRGVLADFEYASESIRQLDLTDRRLSRGRLRAIEAERATITDTALDSLTFERCTLLSSHWERTRLSRVIFQDCRFIGMTVEEQRWANVIFQGCAFEFAQLSTVRSTGPIAFVDCTLKDVAFTGCDFSRGHVSGCDLRDVEFQGGSYAEMDLRGNDLSSVRGAMSLAGAIVSRDQRSDLAEALVSELDLHYVDDER